MTLFFNFLTLRRRLSALPAGERRFAASKRRDVEITRGLKSTALFPPHLTVWFFLLASVFILACCSSQVQAPTRDERERLIVEYYDKLTPAQRREVLSREFENRQAAEAALNSYVQKNRSDSEMRQHTEGRMREITEVWRIADRFIESVDSYLSGRGDSAEDSKQKDELGKQYVEVVKQLGNAQSTIHHTPFEITQKRELLRQNSDYRKQVDDAMKRLSKK